jgi:hypothetical protein
MTSTLRPGHLLSALGALLAAGSLWLPWYGLDLGGAVDDAVVRQAPQGPGGELAAQLVRGFASALASLVQLTGWRAFSTTDVALAAGALAVVLAVGALAAGASLRPSAVARLCGALGVAGALLVAARIVSPPGPDGMLAPRHGAWIALAGTVLVAVGAWWASLSPAADPAAPVVPASQASPASAAFAAAGAPTDSIAPPYA